MISETLVFMVEERSMEEALRGILPRLISETTPWKIIPHDGKSDLRRSIPRKLRAWREPARFIILHDQDQSVCTEVKAQLVALTTAAGRPDSTIRIVCRELESWFLGDLPALEQAYGLQGLAKLAEKARFRDPDHIAFPSRELKAILPGYKKISGARLIGRHMDPSRNRSRSIQTFIQSLRAAESSV